MGLLTSEETGLAVFASVFYDGHIINTFITDPNEQHHFAFGRGHPLPPFRGAQSKVLVAYQKGRRLLKLFEEQISKDPNNPYSTRSWSEFARAAKKIRKDGYCITHDELNLGLTGIAAPIIVTDSKEVVGSVSAVGSTDTFKLLRQERVIDLVIQTTNLIASNMQKPQSTSGAP
ncbi:hypothetical protein CXK94_17970 [Stutzerimonas stutzeri]|uniref:IclR-ED domain-containing protein n=1 Tax=Stutzerimonas stutzeri TaxID=316 RepID=A0A2N8SX64_STUST|nr:hypothetical protein CXK94_17970 [Stutzerimonas stutzeri]